MTDSYHCWCTTSSKSEKVQFFRILYVKSIHILLSLNGYGLQRVGCLLRYHYIIILLLPHTISVWPLSLYFPMLSIIPDSQDLLLNITFFAFFVDVEFSKISLEIFVPYSFISCLILFVVSCHRVLNSPFSIFLFRFIFNVMYLFSLWGYSVLQILSFITSGSHNRPTKAGVHIISRF